MRWLHSSFIFFFWGGVRAVRRTFERFLLGFAITLGIPYAVSAFQPGDVQAQLNSQAAEIAELRELINGKVDNLSLIHI